MNRERLLKALRAQGFTGKTLDEAIAYIKENGIDLKPKGAEAVMDEAAIKAAWAVNRVIELDADEPAAPAPEPTPAQKSAADLLRQKRAQDVQNDREPEGLKIFCKTNERELAKKSYEHRRQRGEKTVFSDANVAEAWTAFNRVAYAQTSGKTYPREAEDRQILVDAGILTKTTSTLVNTNAGILVDPIFVNEVLYNTEPYGLATQIANVRNISGTDDWSIKRKTAIMAMSHLNEGGTLATGNPTFDRVSMHPRKVGVLVDITQEMLDDSAVSYADQWAQSVREARDIRVDTDYFLGDGTSTYGGIVGLGSGLVSGAYVNAAGNSWAAITRANISSLPGIVQNVNLARCAYVCSRQFYSQVMVPMQAALGGVTSNEGVNGGGAKMMSPNIAGAVNAYFNGWPVYFSQIGSTAGVLSQASGSGQKDLFFGDFMGGSMIGLSKDLSIDTSKEVGFTTDKVYMRAITRFDVNICGDGRGSTYGNIVCLQTT